MESLQALQQLAAFVIMYTIQYDYSAAFGTVNAFNVDQKLRNLSGPTFRRSSLSICDIGQQQLMQVGRAQGLQDRHCHWTGYMPVGYS